MAKKKSRKIVKNKIARKVARKPARSKVKKVEPKRKSRPAKPQAAKRAPVQPPPPKAGAFVWHELMTTDPARAKAFYSELFGWKTETMELMPGFNYTLFNHDRQSHAGMTAITPEHGDVRPHWDVYIKGKDVDATAMRCEELGGEIVVPAHDIPVGRWAMLKDPTGATICVYKSNRK
jgi:predicted enzyme related to lactoylglutathione lyase